MSKPPEARGKPKGICRSNHLDVRAQGIPELRSQDILEPYKGKWSSCRRKGRRCNCQRAKVVQSSGTLKVALFIFEKVLIRRSSLTLIKTVKTLQYIY